MPVWSLVTCSPGDRSPEPGESFVAVADTEGGVWHNPVLARYPDVGAALRDWAELEPVLRDWQPSQGKLLDGVRLLTPIPSPTKLVCAGANYSDHLREMGVDEVPPGMEPYFFLLPPTTIVGPDDLIEIPDGPGARVDWEAELGVVIGRRTHRVQVERALEAVAGYTIVNDISARGLHARENPWLHPSPTTGWGPRDRTPSARSAPG